MAAAKRDGTAGTPSLRTLGTGAQQAMPGTAKIDTSQFSGTIPAVRAIPNGGVHTVLNFNFELYDTAALHSSTTDNSRPYGPGCGV